MLSAPLTACHVSPQSSLIFPSCYHYPDHTGVQVMTSISPGISLVFLPCYQPVVTPSQQAGFYCQSLHGISVSVVSDVRSLFRHRCSSPCLDPLPDIVLEPFLSHNSLPRKAVKLPDAFMLRTWLQFPSETGVR